MQRVMIIGSGGAGKSTMAQQLGSMLGLEVFHLDRLYWKPGWTPTPRSEWAALQEALVQQDRWLIDGNYNSTLPIRLGRADTVIFLDYPPLLCAWRAVKRRFMYRGGRTRPDMGEGCQEQVDREFLGWILRFRRKVRPRILQLLSELPATTQVIRLHSPRETAKFLDALAADKPRGDNGSQHNEEH